VLTCCEHDNTIRHQPGERLHHLFEERVDRYRAEQNTSHPAVIGRNRNWSYIQLEEKANQLAHYLLQQGLGPHHRIGLLFGRGIDGYAAMLAILKIQAAYVPLDPAFPADRLAYIAADADLKAILTLSGFEKPAAETGRLVIQLDRHAEKIACCSRSRPTREQTGEPRHQLCYIIYTSGTTGHPKGVPVEHAAICNFVRTAAEIYGYQQTDRVYQGLTMAFDFAVEEIWVPLVVGAALVPAHGGTALLGEELADFLCRERISALCCVPTLLATIDAELPALRLLIVSGEACPRDLLTRWHRPGRIVLNAYGPTETTVTATLARPTPRDRKLTIGKPLPTYSVLILEPGTTRVLPPGREGEICIAGVGVARGYLHRRQQTAKAFIADFLHLAGNPSGLIYRTGDLGLINDEGEVEYRGRIDLQVKIRGYRIELTEIESVLLGIPEIAQAVVTTFEPCPGSRELAAYYTLRDREEDKGFSEQELVETLRIMLPDYMVPAFYERLPAMPMLASDKVDRSALPAPSGRRRNGRGRVFAVPRSPLEKSITRLLAELLQTERISVEDHFFDDLGANSLLMAWFCSRFRQQFPDLDISMRTVYASPTVAKLAASLQAGQAEEKGEKRLNFRPVTDDFKVPGRLSYILCGACQLAVYLIFIIGLITMGGIFLDPVTAAVGFPSRFLRASLFCNGWFFGWTGLAIVAKWLLVGRWKGQKIPLWGVRYFRLWLLKRILHSAPVMLLRGYPLYTLYLRLLGAKIGRNTVLEGQVSPLCADLLTIGNNSVLGKDARIVPYKARNGYIHTGPVRLGNGVSIGDGSIIDINTEMKNGSSLAHASCVQEGQVLASDTHYHGNPAEKTTAARRLKTDKRVSSGRIILFSLLQVWVYCCLLLPAGLLLCLRLQEGLAGLCASCTGLSLYSGILGLSGCIFMSLSAGIILVNTIIPRLLNRLLQPDKVYVLYGFHYVIFKVVQRLSNSAFLTNLFGDSSYIIHYMRWVGYRFGRIIQTGSNFGLEHRHDNPFLCRFGAGTMISDGFHMANCEPAPTGFRLRKNSVGEKNFIGNRVFYPVNGKTGDNCLIATKAMVPVEGELREHQGILGSPPFRIPRSVERDKTFTEDQGAKGAAFQKAGLARKNRANLKTIGLCLLSWWVYLVAILAADCTAVRYEYLQGPWEALLLGVLFTLFSIGYFIVRERAVVGFGPMRPLFVSIYDAEYWRVERLWKHSEMFLRHLWTGTPFRYFINRLCGIRQGKMVFDDGFAASEKTLVSIGDYSNLNEHCVLQAHSLEDGVYKSDHIVVGDRCSIEPAAFVHYGVTLAQEVTLATDSFIMKGEKPAEKTTWMGNPARCVESVVSSKQRSNKAVF